MWITEGGGERVHGGMLLVELGDEKSGDLDKNLHARSLER